MPARLRIVVKLKFLVALIVPPSPRGSEDPARFDLSACLDPGQPLQIVIVH